MRDSMIKMFVMDVDGTLTDGYLYYGVEGELFKKFSVTDGYGIRLLKEIGIIPVILSGRDSTISRSRFKDIEISEIHLGILDKKEILIEVCSKYEIKLEEVAYVGDDQNDFDVMSNVGYPFALSNSIDKIKTISIYTASKSGGESGVREIIDYLINKHNYL